MSTAYTPASARAEGLSMNNTCFASGDHEGITQQPPVVNWRNSGVGVGMIVGVGSGVFVGRTVGNAAIVGVTTASIVATGIGASDEQAVMNNSQITHHTIRIMPLVSSFILARV